MSDYSLLDAAKTASKETVAVLNQLNDALGKVNDGESAEQAIPAIKEYGESVRRRQLVLRKLYAEKPDDKETVAFLENDDPDFEKANRRLGRELRRLKKVHDAHHLEAEISKTLKEAMGYPSK